MNMTINSTNSLYTDIYKSDINNLTKDCSITPKTSSTDYNTQTDKYNLSTAEYSISAASTTSVTYGNSSGIEQAIIGIMSKIPASEARQYQIALRDLGFYSGNFSGDIGNKTFLTAVQNFEKVYNDSISNGFSNALRKQILSVAEKYNTCVKSTGMKNLVNTFNLDVTQQNTIAKTWVFLKEGMGLTSNQTAGVMGNIYAESKFSCTNAQDRLGYPGLYNPEYNFSASDKIGYGLIQWSFGSRKACLEEMSKVMNKPVSDINVQLATLRQEVTTGDYSDEWNKLKNTSTYTQASDVFLAEIEQAGTLNYSTRRGYANKFYTFLYNSY